jgi:hypothetical protein
MSTTTIPVSNPPAESVQDSLQKELANWLRAASREEQEADRAELAELRRHVAKTHSSTSHGFALLGLPLKLRPLLSAIIAAAYDEKMTTTAPDGATVVTASYAALVELLFRSGDGRTFEAKKSEVRRLIKALRTWQEDKKITLCVISGGGREETEKGETIYHDTEFKLVFLDAIVRALYNNPTPEKMRAAVRLEIATMMKLPPFDARWQPRGPTPEEMQKRERKAALTMALKAAEKEQDFHGDPVSFAERLAQEIVDAAREKWGETPYQKGESDVQAIDNNELESGGVCRIRHTPPLVLLKTKEDTEIAPNSNTAQVLEPDVARVTLAPEACEASDEARALATTGGVDALRRQNKFRPFEGSQGAAASFVPNGQGQTGSKRLTESEWEALCDDCICASTHFYDVEAGRYIRDCNNPQDHIEDCLLRLICEGEVERS